jgi:hypothetical protein
LLVTVLGELERLLDLPHRQRLGGMARLLRATRGSSERKHRCQKQDCAEVNIPASFSR